MVMWYISVSLYSILSFIKSIFHDPLLLHLDRRVSKKKMKKLFRFESIWLKKPQCEEIVQNAWSDGVLAQSDFPLVSCINQCRMQLEAWNKNVFGHVGRKINELQKHLEWLELQHRRHEGHKNGVKQMA